MDNKLCVFVQESGLETTHAQQILDNFTSFFEGAKELEIEAKTINVTDITQTELMSKARVIRLKLKDVRVKAEHTRKALKERSLRESKAIDGIANIIKALIIPLEEHLEKQEKFIELKIARELDEREAKRRRELAPYVSDVSVFNLREMEEDDYQKFLETYRVAYKAQKEAEIQAEKDRIKREKEEEKKRIEMQKENERLKREVEEKNKENEQRFAREQEEAKQRKIRKISELETKMLEDLNFLFESVGDEVQLTEEGKKVYDFIVKFIQ